MVAAAIAGSAGASLLGGVLSSGSASQAADVQSAAAQQAAQLQAAEFQITQGNLAPYVGVGSGPNGVVNSLLAGFQPGGQLTNTTAPFTAPANFGPPTAATNASTTPAAFNNSTWGLGANQQAALAATPGYQFTLQQGLRGVQNSAAANGLGVSGNALAGAANYATGLADTTYNQQYQNALTGQAQNFSQTLSGQNQGFAQALASETQQASQDTSFYNTYLNSILAPQAQQYNMLSGALGLGENAAVGTGNLGQQAVTGANSALLGGATAQASGLIGSTNALTSGLSSAGNSLQNYLLLNALTGGVGLGNTVGSNVT